MWRHCPGHLNPADLPSRGSSGKDLVRNEKWWNGPDFLTLPEDQWPTDPQLTHHDEELVRTEMIKQPPIIMASHSTDTEVPVQVEKVIDPERYSTKTKLVRVTALVLRFIKKLRKQPCAMAEINANDVMEAEKLWIRNIQSASFAEEIECFRTGKPNSRVKQLRLFIDDDSIIRCEGRIHHSTVPADAKQPILLPPKHHYTKLIIRDSHILVHHDGIRETLNCVRGKYWILRGRESVKGIVRRCVTCKRLEAKPFAAPKEPVLPSSRVSEDPPCTNTGIDFAGPLYAVKNEISEKVYICLFTCASTRAVHLELVPSLSVPSFLQAFRRFVSRRDLPSRLITDNTKTFKGAAKEVKNIIRSTEVQREMASRGVVWEFIVEKAPWQGGFYERMIQNTKVV